VLSVDPVQIFIHCALLELFLGSHIARLQTNGTLFAETARRWWEDVQRADERGTLLVSFTAFVTVGARR